MSKLAVTKKIGVPVPAVMPPDVTHLVAYYGAPGFTPSYSQPERVAVPLAELARTSKDGQEYFVFDPAGVTLPAEDGNVEFSFVLADLTDGEEGDFSPVVSVPLDREPPVTLGAPVLLD